MTLLAEDVAAEVVAAVEEAGHVAVAHAVAHAVAEDDRVGHSAGAGRAPVPAGRALARVDRGPLAPAAHVPAQAGRVARGPAAAALAVERTGLAEDVLTSVADPVAAIAPAVATGLAEEIVPAVGGPESATALAAAIAPATVLEIAQEMEIDLATAGPESATDPVVAIDPEIDRATALVTVPAIAPGMEIVPAIVLATAPETGRVIAPGIVRPDTAPVAQDTDIVPVTEEDAGIATITTTRIGITAVGTDIGDTGGAIIRPPGALSVLD